MVIYYTSWQNIYYICGYILLYISTNSDNMTLKFFEIWNNTKIWPFPIILSDSPFSEEEWRVNVRCLNHRILKRLRQKQSVAIILVVWDMVIRKFTLFWDCSYGAMKVYFHGQWLGQKCRIVKFKTQFSKVIIKLFFNYLRKKS